LLCRLRCGIAMASVVQAMMPLLAAWLCISHVKAYRYGEGLPEACSLEGLAGLLASPGRGRPPPYLRMPDECKPDGHVPMVGMLPTAGGSFKARCYTEAKAAALQVDMQGYPLESQEAIKLASDLQVRGEPVPQCEPISKPNVEPKSEPNPAIAMHSEGGKEGQKSVAEGAEGTSGLGQTNDAHAPQRDSEKVIREHDGTASKQETDETAPALSDTFGVFDQNKDGELDFDELLDFKHEQFVEHILKTVQQGKAQVSILTFSFPFQVKVHKTMAALDKDRDGKLNLVEFQNFK